MSKCKFSALARELAGERGLWYGMSIFDGYYYVGTVAQLERIGCIGVVRGLAE